MAKKDLAKFCSEYLAAHTELRSNISAIANAQHFAKAMVDAGTQAGFTFSESEVREVMEIAGARPVGGELSESQLESVAGGRKAGEHPQEYLIIKMTDILVSG